MRHIIKITSSNPDGGTAEVRHCVVDGDNELKKITERADKLDYSVNVTSLGCVRDLPDCFKTPF